MDEKTFTHQLGDNATNATSSESGKVIGRAEYLTSEPNYLVRHKTATGTAADSWWAQSDLATKDA